MYSEIVDTRFFLILTCNMGSLLILGKRHMKNQSIVILVAALKTFIGVSTVMADTNTYKCVTINRPSTGFTISAAKSWFPTNTTHTIKGNTAKGYIFGDTLSGTVSFKGTRTIIKYDFEGRKEDYILTYVFFSNGKMSTRLGSTGIYAPHSPARGRCTKTSTTTQSKTSVKKKTTIKKPSGPNIPKQVQTELNRLGCSVGTADGAVGPASKRGLAKFANVTGVTGYSVSEFSNKQFLGFLKGMPAGFCN